MSKKEKLLKHIKERSTEQPTWGITLIVINEQMCHPENISFKGDDAAYKSAYIDVTYDDNLVHKNAAHIRIGGWE